MTEQLVFHATGDWEENRVIITARPTSSRQIIPEVELLIDESWKAIQRQRPDMKLFDGPMCRLEDWGVENDTLRLSLSATSYRVFLGTNLSHPELAERFGRDVLANPVGASSALLSSDGYLLMGVRNDRVAYHPNRVHPFAGAVEPRDGGNVFNCVRRELAEELAFDDSDIAEIRCTGIAEDIALRQPELLFRVRATRTRDEILAKMDRDEHHESWSVAADAQSVAQALRDPKLTPVGAASLLLWGRVTFGGAWFDAARQHACPGRDAPIG